jgi:hypothetical protein
MKRADREPGLLAAIEAMGGASALARALGISAPAMVKWTRVPAERILEVERITLIPREQLRPDLFLAPRPETLTPPVENENEADGQKPNGQTPNLPGAEFRRRLEQLGLSQRGFAKMIQMNVATVRS